MNSSSGQSTHYDLNDQKLQHSATTATKRLQVSTRGGKSIATNVAYREGRREADISPTRVAQFLAVYATRI